jgi:hypothetical protein
VLYTVDMTIRQFSTEEIARMRQEMWTQFAPANGEELTSRRVKGTIITGDELVDESPDQLPDQPPAQR